jgi:hypothetical protein
VSFIFLTSHAAALSGQRKPDILSTTVQFCIQPAAGFAAAASLLLPRRFIRTSPRLTMQQLSVYLAQKLGVLAPDGFIDYKALARHCGSDVVPYNSSQSSSSSSSVDAAAPGTASPVSPLAIAPSRSLLPVDVFQIYVASDAQGTVVAGSRPLHADTTIDKARSQRGAMVFFPLESDVQASLAIQQEQAAVKQAAETALSHAKAASEGLSAAKCPPPPQSAAFASDASSVNASLSADSTQTRAPVAVLASNLECWKMVVFAYRIVPLAELCE